jgi:hypothetical protein
LGKPQTLLEGLCGHALKFGCESFGVVYEEGFQRAWAQIDGAPTRIANFKRNGRDAEAARSDTANPTPTFNGR